MNEKTKAFLNSYEFEEIDVKELSNLILDDMRNGLTGKKSCQDMILTYLDPSEIRAKKKSVIALDAGGTNFRSCLANFSDDGSFSVSDFQKSAMPGTKSKLTKDEFFLEIAKKIDYLKDRAGEIGFCFSYPMQITEDGDGILMEFSKEVKVENCAGSKIGEELKKALKKCGWKIEPKITLLNDTAAALLSGTGSADYSSYIGFILGTGMNAAYVQGEWNGIKKQIVVCESAKFANMRRSKFDEILDKNSANPNCSPLEKLCSGAYLGPLGLIVLKEAAKSGLFSADFAKKVESIENLSLIELSGFLIDSDFESGKFADFFGAGAEDAKIVFALFDALADRSARISAAILLANLEQCGGGKAEKPVRIACNGTTFFKAYKVAERTKAYLKECADGIKYEFLGEEADITRGTALSAM